MMTTKLITLDLDTPPTDFRRAVAIPDAITDGELRVRFTFVWRDRIEGALLFERLLNEARVLLAAVQERADETRDTGAIARDAIAHDIQTLREMATGWNINAPFDDVHLEKFFIRYPAAALAITTTYRAAIMDGE
jgi:hypothetical protein